MIRDLAALIKAHRQSRKIWTPKEALLGRDRRIFFRVPVHVACRLDSDVFGLESPATVVDVSLGGAGLTAPVSWPEGSQVRIRFDEYAFQVNGVICFRLEGKSTMRYGVQFQRLGVRALLQLRKILRERHQGPLSIR